MQSRKHEDFLIQSPAAKLRDRRLELGRDPCAMPRRDVLERSPRSRRSLSPRKLRPPLGGDRRSSSLERRDYGWDLSGVRDDRVRSRSPPFGQVHKRPHYDEGISSRDLPPTELRRRYEFFEYMDGDTDANTGLKHEYGYEHRTSRVIREKDLDGSRLSDASGHGMSGQKSMVLEEGAAQRPFRLPADFGATSKYVEGGGNFSLSSANMDLGWFKDERIRYLDPLLLDKLSAMESYGKGEKPMFHSRDVSYPTMPASQSKDLKGTSQFKDFGSTTSGISRASFSGSYRDDMPFPTDEFPRSSAKLTDPLGFSGYGQRHILDSGRDPAAEHKDLTCYSQDTFSPTRGEPQDYLYPRPGKRESDDHGYPSNNLHRRMALYKRVDYDHRDFLRPSMMDPIAEHVDNNECSHRNLRDSCLWDNPSMQKQTVSNYNGMSRSSTASKQGGEYLNSGSAHIEFGRRVSREQEISHLDVSWDHEISNLRLDYGFGRDAGPASHKERMRNSPEFKYEAEVHRPAVRTERMKAEEFGTYDPSDSVLKRKYSMDEEMSGHSSRRMMSSKWNNSSRIQDLDDRGEEWIGQDTSNSFSSRSVGYDHNLYRRLKRTYDGADRHRGSASEDWLSSHDLVEHVQEHSIKEYKPSGRYIKGHSRPGSVSWHNSYRFNRRNVLPKPHNVWIRGRDDNQVDMHTNEVDQSEDWVSSGKSELPEDSEEFKQLVHEAFLSFTKKLNEIPAVRKRYKEQGRAGSLFCIVCGRSLSKEFMDTQRLVTHAFMSHKVGLRAQHLGLHKAICVLLGWNSEVASDVITWVPEAISSAESWAQKEDLILWAPVIVIHNSSISDNEPEGQKVITVEALGDFLRGKGFGGGKVKVCLGKPANHSILLVKFLGTFSGLQGAERLHNSFAENKHGRTDFERIASSKGKSSDSGEGGKQGCSVEELVLYGYMGIAEDLDKVDYDTKRKCTIKSRKEIKDLENAPVKPE
uniref:XS domain-containing protein n=1 Tax=Davidia involucrata TaxID=16924 RepID=A0A5B6ZBJ2_DAVIN